MHYGAFPLRVRRGGGCRWQKLLRIRWRLARTFFDREITQRTSPMSGGRDLRWTTTMIQRRRMSPALMRRLLPTTTFMKDNHGVGMASIGVLLRVGITTSHHSPMVGPHRVSRSSTYSFISFRRHGLLRSSLQRRARPCNNQGEMDQHNRSRLGR